ncbi:hypothetical protein [Hymenobacter jejuensis]|uniref:Lipoprotein n=1 Tax=Hymenobacter jejuensis TaxID=2502781 RepID=A0A5B7ZYB3_9BACT|nr:hypothetical protein [Hymenobacter jejuensis]QDA59496.1 hypothetical protein FHG12_04960 [Hymenobacter jejuensis]
MKKTLLLLTSAAALTMASCSQDKPADTATTTTTTTTTTTSDAAYRDRADRIAQKMATDMKITDTAVVSRVRTAYYNRARRLSELRSQYTSDTTGMAAAMRDANTETDSEFKTIFTDPAQYQAYETNRATYDDANYADNSSSSDAMSSSDSSGTTMSADASSGSASDAGSTTSMSVDKAKLKGDNGSKMKVKSDGDVKVKDSEGNKGKMDADDGTVKSKPVDAPKTKIK